MSQAGAEPNLFLRRITMPAESIALVLVNLADVVLTWAIIVDPTMGGYESNQIAAFWLVRAGLPGMVAYKFFLVGFVLVICELIHKYKPVVARRLMTFLCVIVGVVICYSLALVVKHHMIRVLMESGPV